MQVYDYNYLHVYFISLYLDTNVTQPNAFPTLVMINPPLCSNDLFHFTSARHDTYSTFPSNRVCKITKEHKRARARNRING